MKSWYSLEDKPHLQSSKEEGDFKGLMEAYEDQELTLFFQELSLLKQVPLSYLVCDQTYLQSESLNLFYIDPDWVSCLIQGALSLGDRGIQDRLYHERIASHLVQTVHAGQAEVISGFLLNSRVVSGWPGLTVQCFENGKVLPIYRLEQLNESLLLCLVGGNMDAIHFTEPTEGISMGFTEKATGEMVLELVSLEEGKTGTPLPGQELSPVYRRNSPNGVLDLEEMTKQMMDRLSLSQEKRNAFSALEFTAELLTRRVTYQISVQRGTAAAVPSP